MSALLPPATTPFMAGHFVSPLNVAHWLDDSGEALCGRFTPDPFDRKPAAAETPRCKFCARLRPIGDATPEKDAQYRKQFRVRRAELNKAQAKVDRDVANTQRDRIIAAAARNPNLGHVELGRRLCLTARQVKWALTARAP